MKILRIKFCNDCPYFMTDHEFDHTCLHPFWADVYGVGIFFETCDEKGNYDLPDWCPLEDEKDIL